LNKIKRGTLRKNHVVYKILMLKAVHTLWVLMILTFILLSCTSEINHQHMNGGKDKPAVKQVLLIGDGAYTKQSIDDLIKKSGIRRQGFVVIVPTSFLPNDEKARALQYEFYKRLVRAVHILNLNPKSNIENTDILAIENASVLCFIGGKRNEFMNLANHTPLKSAILNAYDKGALIVGFGNATTLLPNQYLNFNTDTIHHSKSIIFSPGLGLIGKVVVENRVNFKNDEAEIQKEVEKQHCIVLGLDDQACVWISDSNAIVIGEKEVRMISPGNPPAILQKGQKIKLPF